MIRVIGPRDPKDANAILTVSRSTTWSKGLSPFFVGPVPCYDGLVAKNMENAWQYAKLYPVHADRKGDPIELYYQWRDAGWAKNHADRYPMGYAAKPLCSLWAGERLNYIEARQRIYVPLYAAAVRRTSAYAMLEQEYALNPDLVLWDFDGYDHRKMGMTYRKALLDPNRKFGHAFVLAMMLDNVLDDVLDGKDI